MSSLYGEFIGVCIIILVGNVPFFLTDIFCKGQQKSLVFQSVRYYNYKF